MERDIGKCSDGGNATVRGRCGGQSGGAISAASVLTEESHTELCLKTEFFPCFNTWRY